MIRKVIINMRKNKQRCQKSQKISALKSSDRNYKSMMQNG